jgi:hypothetical protein
MRPSQTASIAGKASPLSFFAGTVELSFFGGTVELSFFAGTVE